MKEIFKLDDDIKAAEEEVIGVVELDTGRTTARSEGKS